MGCWNKTCGLTNLPIMRGEDTYVFVLQRLKEVHDHCYATNIYKPLLLPFVSTYNDYGGGIPAAARQDGPMDMIRKVRSSPRNMHAGTYATP